MGAGVATIGRRPYAVGLYWENSPAGRVAQAAKEAARQPGQQADFYALRAGTKDGRVPQFGLGQKGAGHKAGMPVFAACIANQQVGSWAGAFRVREGTIVTVVRDDLLVPDGDQIYLNESDARDRLLQEMGFGGLQRIYAPEAWAIPGADSMPVSLLLDERRDVTLRAISIPKSVLIGGGVVLLLIALGFGVNWYLQSQAQEEADRQAEIDRIKNAALGHIPGMDQQPQYPPPERKWEKEPQPLAYIENCRAGLAQVIPSIASWRMNSLSCSGSGVVTIWNRESGFSAPPKNWSVNETGTIATYNVPLPQLTPRGPESLTDPKDVTRRYLNQNWPGSVARAPDDPPPPPPPDYQGPWNPPPPPWVKRSFTLTVTQLPESLPLYFGNLPGVVINSLNFTPNGSVGGTWTIEGVIYENRI